MKKGFTLIELLAVIVILAIIAVIAVPIVLNIINESKDNATLRSADFYLDAVEFSVSQAALKDKLIQDGTYNILESGNMCLQYEGETCKEELIIEVNGEKPTSGTVTIKNGEIDNIDLALNNKIVTKNEKGDLVIKEEPTERPLCILVNGYTENTIGAKYSCDFGGGARIFYILELGSNKVEGSLLKDDEVALILEGNYDTTNIYWYNSTSKLDEIASVWTKVDRSQLMLPSVYQIAEADGKSYSFSGFSVSETNAWLYNWPDNPNYNSEYWTRSGFTDKYEWAYCVSYSGNVGYVNINGPAYYVRPVVNIKL